MDPGHAERDARAESVVGRLGGARFLVSLALTGAVAALALADTGPSPLDYLKLLLTAPVVLWAGLPIYRDARAAVLRHHLSIDVLVTVAVAVSFAGSLAALALGRAGFFSSTASIVTVFLAVRGIDAELAGWAEGCAPDANPQVRLGSGAARALVPLALAVAAATFLGWMLAGHEHRALEAAVAALVVTTPAALAFGVPAAQHAGLARLADLGLHVDAGTLEDVASCDEVVVDLTRVTTGSYRVVNVCRAEGAGRRELLALAASAAQAWDHPAAMCLGRLTGLDVVAPFAVRVDADLGVSGTVAGTPVVVGRCELLAREGIPESSWLESEASRIAAEGGLAIWVAAEGRAKGVLDLRAEVLPEARDAVDTLRKADLDVVLAAAESAPGAVAVARRVGIEKVVARGGDSREPAVLAGRRSPCRGGGGESTFVPLPVEDLRTAAAAVRLARPTLRVRRRSLAWAFSYNAVALPLAASGILQPPVAVLATVGASFVPLFAASRLRRCAGHMRPVT